MAMSLEELLAEEGFKGRGSKSMPRASFQADAANLQFYKGQDQQTSGSVSGVKKTVRAKSDISLYNLPGEAPASVKSKKPRENLAGHYRGSNIEIAKNVERRGSKHSKETGSGEGTSEIVEVEVQNNRKYNDVYFNGVFSDDGSDDKDRDVREVKYKQSERDDVRTDTNFGFNSNKGHPGRITSSDYLKKTFDISSSRSSRSSISSKTLDDRRNHRNLGIEQAAAAPALDEASVQAIVSIFSGSAKQFLEDEDFRTSLRHNSFASLNFVGQDEGINTDSKVIANLEQAIETVEKAAEESATAKELKRVSLQLSIITGLNSNDLRDRCTSGIPNFKLSACAHLYLGVIYKIQKKDKISAKHLLQVFCDSPFQARTKLLTDLWDHVFLPQLSHVKIWYDNETVSLKDSPIKARKLKLLEKIYNETLDYGTYQFAKYYKDWLNEGVEAPSVPSIQVPPISVRLIQQEGRSQSPDNGDHIGHLPSQPVVSKKIYDSVFGHSHNQVVEIEDYEEENFGLSARSSCGSVVEELEAFSCNPEAVRNMDQAYDPYRESHQGLLMSKRNCSPKKESPDDEVILEKLAKSVFEVQQSNTSVDAAVSFTRPKFEDDLYPELLPTNINSPSEGIPEEYTCPLTGLLFEDPVTLETGQTFERAAIRRWLDKGNMTCPVTGKVLERLTVPDTNFILKHVVDNWKSKSRRHLFALTTQIPRCSMEFNPLKQRIAVFVIEQLVIASSQQEREKNVKWLVCLGGLQFLIRRFNFGSLEEKMSVSKLFCHFIQVDSGCRNQIAGSIDKSCLLELLYCDLSKARLDVVVLLTELISQNRKKDAKYLLTGFRCEEIEKVLDVLVSYVVDCPSDQRPLVAALMLHFDLLVMPQKYSMYKEEAVNAFTLALERSLSDEKVREGCCRALLILGARLSFSGKVMTEDWVLKEAGFLGRPEIDFPDMEEGNFVVDEVTEMVEDSDEEEAREKWLLNLSALLLGEGKKPFWESVCKCLASGNLMIVRVCLTTVAWLTAEIASLPETAIQPTEFSALISQLTDCVENGLLVELKILASMALFNLFKIPGCRDVILRSAKEIAISLENLAEVTWTAKELCAMISREAEIV